jgi:hypothetical protein
MASTARAIAWRDDLASELAKRLSLTVTKSFASDGAPALLVGAAAGGADGFYLKLTPVSTIAKDVLGLSQNVYTPHVAQVAFEADYAGATDSVANVVTQKTQLTILGCLVAKGVKVEWYESATGTAPSESTIVAGNLKASFEIHPQYPGMASL